ncbi:helix-turn-helix domain-containing protein [Chromobacterium violaceum]|uniref:helix-turn-helix domain-containing protein n=1 Tax=Chromobacterium violaceum TaxID=536 RepID=UPI001B32981B|nr:helix-turn-helix domain-containing protein [Chromobacterium violaceum]MBP4047296.1 helix-turn-helix domain-containing protein [Chromobacterium violaceum]
MTNQSLSIHIATPPYDASSYILNIVKNHGAAKIAHPDEEIISENVIAIGSGALEAYLNDLTVISHISEGMIIGLSNYFSKQTNRLRIHYKAITTSLYYECHSSDLIKIESDCRLLRAASEYISWEFHHILNIKSILETGDAYTRVKFCLEWLESSPMPYKKRYTAIAFINSRTIISRGHALAILKELKSGGYIKIVNGYLQGISKELPSRW